MLHHHRKRFFYAFHGLLIVFKEEASFRFQFVFLVLIVLLSWLFRISATEWSLVIIVSALVLVLECLNSAVERMLNAVEPRLHGTVAMIKDILAGAVLLAGAAAAAVGLIIFLPKLF